MYFSLPIEQIISSWREVNGSVYEREDTSYMPFLKNRVRRHRPDLHALEVLEKAIDLKRKELNKLVSDEYADTNND